MHLLPLEKAPKKRPDFSFAMNSALPPSVPSAFEEDDVISLVPIWSLIRRYRRWLEAAFFSLVFLGAGGLAMTWLLLPQNTTGSIGLVFKFEGAAQGKYPNKTSFSPSDLLGGEVLREVYASNQLETYLTFDKFKSSLSLEPSGWERAFLDLEYSAKLEDRKLSFAERQQLSDEYQKRRAALPLVEYRVLWHHRERPAKLVPQALQAKVLEDIPRHWARHAVYQKKVLEAVGFFPGRIQSENSEAKIISNSIDLGERIRALSLSLSELLGMPGAAHVLLGDGTSLVDLSIRLQVLRENGLNNIRGALQAYTQTADEKFALVKVLQDRLRARQKILLLEKGRLQPHEEAYRDYLASRPGAEKSRAGSNRSLAAAGPTLQISDAFLGKWMEMTKSVADETYRQDLVDRMVAGRERVLDAQANLQEIESYLTDFHERQAPEEKVSPGRAEAKKSTQDLQKSARDLEVSRVKALQAMQEAATELNAIIVAADQLRSLQIKNYQVPQASMYQVDYPFSFESSSLLTPRNAGLWFTAFVVVGLGITLVACWAHDQANKPQA